MKRLMKLKTDLNRALDLLENTERMYAGTLRAAPIPAAIAELKRVRMSLYDVAVSLGDFVEIPCPHCQGTGLYADEDCGMCGGCDTVLQ